VTLRSRTLIVTGATLLAAVVVLYVVLSTIVVGGFLAVERQQDMTNVERVLNALHTQVVSLNSLASDWANWNDSYNYVAHPNAAYAADNLNVPTLSGMGLNAVVYARPDGHVVFATGLNVTGTRFVPLARGLLHRLRPGDPLLCCKTPGQTLIGLVSLPGGVMEVVSRPILTSSGAGPVRGTLLFGQWLEPVNSRLLQRVVHYPLELQPYGEAHLPADFAAARHTLTARHDVILSARSATTMVAYALVTDVYGRPALLVRVHLPRLAYRQALQSLRYLVLALVAVGLVLILATFVLLERIILSRLARLNEGVARVGTTGDLSVHIDLPGKDEMSRLATTFNSTLRALRESLHREEVLQQQVAELRIEIDEAKKAKAVEEIVDTDYFRDLAARASDMRRRMKGQVEPT